MANICVISGKIDRAGGGETVTALLVKALLNNHTVHLITPGLDARKVKAIHNLEIEKCKVHCAPVLSSRWIILSKLVNKLSLRKTFLRIAHNNNFDAVIDFVNIGMRIWRVPAKLKDKYFIYVVGCPPKYATRSIDSVPSMVLNTLSSLIPTRLPSYSKIIAVSNTRAKMIKQTWNKNTMGILYPPVDVDYYKYDGDVIKENNIVVLGRIAPEKRLIYALDTMAQVLKREKNKDIKMVIIGYVISNRYLSKVIAHAHKLGINAHVEILTNASREVIRENLMRAKVSLLTQISPESFNLTIIESMGAGAIPVVPKSGAGAWDEILNYGKCGYGYNDIEEAADIIQHVINLESSDLNSLNQKVVKRAEDFDEFAFRKKLLQLLTEF